MLYRSCRVIHMNPKKLDLHFSNFATIFYAFYKDQPKPNTIEDSHL
jgi:hypothetical protein